MTEGKRSALEALKESSDGLRGTLPAELDDPAPSFGSDAAQLLKFHGIYQQDDRDTRRERGRQGLGKDFRCMVRASIPGGVLTSEQYVALDDLADDVGSPGLRVTTRQGIQYHMVRKGDLRGLVARMNERLVTTLAACGDVVRNVMCCPAPLPDREHAALQETASELSAELKPRTQAYWQLWVDGELAASASAPESAPSEAEDGVDPLYGPTYLPRKFKIGFAFPGDNCVDAYTHDVGIVGHLDGPEVTAFTVLVGGGLGMSHNNPSTYPRLGDPLATVEPSALTDTVKAVIGVQRDHGDRGDRKHARLKYLIDDWGLDAFRDEVSRRLGTELPAPRALEWPSTDDHLGWAEQADGRWFLGVRVPSGRIEDGETKLRTALRRVAQDYADGVRLTPRQDVLLTGIAAADREEVETLLRDHGVALHDEIAPVARHAMACPAMPTCGLAIAEAERALPDVLDGVEDELRAVGLDGEPLHLRMTGCPNGCSRPYSTEIGVVGRGKDHYSVFLGGDAAGTRLNRVYADRVGTDELGDVLRPVLKAFADERRDGEAFGDYCDRVGVDALRERFGAEA